MRAAEWDFRSVCGYAKELIPGFTAGCVLERNGELKSWINSGDIGPNSSVEFWGQLSGMDLSDTEWKSPRSSLWSSLKGAQAVHVVPRHLPEEQHFMKEAVGHLCRDDLQEAKVGGVKGHHGPESVQFQILPSQPWGIHATKREGCPSDSFPIDRPVGLSIKLAASPAHLRCDLKKPSLGILKINNGHSHVIEPGMGQSTLVVQVTGKLHPECEIISEIKKDEEQCLRSIKENGNASVQGCGMIWDGALCWPHAAHGEAVNVSCPAAFLQFSPILGTIVRNCTSQGWSDPLPTDLTACVMDAATPMAEVSYYGTIQMIYTVGYSLSVVVLSVAVVILLIFRRLHCTRNYIHIQLFITFIFRALSVFIKDAVLFGDGDIDHCTFSTAGCKVAVVFCYFCMMTNYFWLLVEALYLNSLLVVSFSYGRKYFWWWSVLGWGVPTVCTIAWVITKFKFEDTECWDIIEDSPYWWIIKGPIVTSVAINFVLFVNIVRILVQKLIPKEVHMANSSQYRRLTKSTLLLVPLFGVHYIVCAFPPDGAVLPIRLYLDLCIGSFQGFIVGVLYCFLNQEVQSEIHGRWLRKQLNSYWAVPVVGKSQLDTSC
ncbi:growth hormone-releasing hormone receptor-like [Heptranchias perlo]|uniref:growth hormone-releasing hormone receptor-like n=1 Tax=Heptranchias perlo TaxID=212740 RepID=UPI00355ABB81